MEKYNWDLDSLLEGKNVETLFEEWIKENEKLIKIFPTFYLSKNQFKKWININERVELIENRLYNFISNKLNEELTNSQWLGLLQKFNKYSNIFHVRTSNYVNLVIANNKKISNYLNEDSELKQYKREFELIYRLKTHILSQEQEKVISKLGILGSSISDIFTTLTDNDIKIDDALDSKGKIYKINTQSDVSRLLKNKDRTLRKNVWINFHKSFNNYINTLTQTMYYNYLQFNTYAKIRNFKDYIDAAAFNDEINLDFILNLYSKIEKFKDLHFAYKCKYS